MKQNIKVRNYNLVFKKNKLKATEKLLKKFVY